ncbi:MAG: polysaccharide deacetylase family protein [Spirochaetales bacterium]|nr:polysaccharide deacetylase family protein [Spirochaetales bacterium]
MIPYYRKLNRPVEKNKQKKKDMSSRDYYLIIVLISFSVGILMCMVFFSWSPLDMGKWTNNYMNFKPIRTINTAKLKGTITIAELETPLKGGIVTVLHRNAIVGADGIYTLPPIKPGIYSIRITYHNRILKEEDILLLPGANNHSFAINSIIPDIMVRHIPEDMPDSGMFRPVTPGVYDRGNPALKRVAITLDDGWFEHNELLDLLHSYGIRCTVFIVGGRGIGDGRPHWIKKMDDMGFEVCQHTLDHTTITSLPDDKLEENIRKAQKNISKVTHKIYPYFRPPYGTYDKRTLDILAGNGYKIILWTVSIQDTRRGARTENQVAYVLKHLRNGAIILAHFRAYNTYKVIEELIPKIIEQGYDIVTVSEVLEGLAITK